MLWHNMTWHVRHTRRLRCMLLDVLCSSSTCSFKLMTFSASVPRSCDNVTLSSNVYLYLSRMMYFLTFNGFNIWAFWISNSFTWVSTESNLMLKSLYISSTLELLAFQSLSIYNTKDNHNKEFIHNQNKEQN